MLGLHGIDGMMREMMQMSNTMMRQMMVSGMPNSLLDADGAGGSGFGGNGSAFFYSSSAQSFNSADPSQNFVRTATTTAGPGGVLETRTAVRDGREGCEKLGMRRQLGDRVAQVERVRNLQTGEEQTRKTIHNLPNDDEEAFDREWMAAAGRTLPQFTTRTSGLDTSTPAITYNPSPQPVLAITERPSGGGYAPPTGTATRDMPTDSPGASYRTHGVQTGTTRATYQPIPQHYPTATSPQTTTLRTQPATTTRYAQPVRVPVVNSERGGSGAPPFSGTSPYASRSAAPSAVSATGGPRLTTQPARQPRLHRDGSYW